ncbi:MAG: DnaD domain protein [Bacilli bacterium]|nr:DnaD domain protein [Bacilli bacterium]
MKKVRRNDYYSIRRNAYFSYFDVCFLLDLYAPLIGATAASTYLALQQDNYSRNEEVGEVGTLLDSLRISAGEFEEALSYLEGIGLVKTYLSVGEESSYFAFELYPPYSPSEFFSDPLLYGTLLKYLGEDNVRLLVKKYAPSSFKKDGMKNVSSSFKQRFNPNLNEDYYMSPSPKTKSRKKGKVETGFELGAFLRTCNSLGIENSRFNQGDLDYVEKIASLYGLDSSGSGEIASECFATSGVGTYFDREKFAISAEKSAPFAYFHQEKGEKSEVSSSTALAMKIRQMDSMAPAKWLSIKQKGHRPASADLKLLRTLSIEMGLPNGVINALIDYILERNNNELSAAYAEKVAGSLMREGCKTARDAMTYLKDNDKRKKAPKKTVTPEYKKEEEPKVEGEKEKEGEAYSDEELDAMFAELGLESKKKKPNN